MVRSNTELKVDALRRVGISPEPFQRIRNDGANSRHHAIENPMRILVYASDSDKEAKQVIETLRLEGHHASLRNAQFYQGEIEPADGIVVRHGQSRNIVDAYEAADKPVQFFGLEATEHVEPTADPDNSTEAEPDHSSPEKEPHANTDHASEHPQRRRGKNKKQAE
jgi:hypothetical protein